jgi:hypothetical protein
MSIWHYIWPWSKEAAKARKVQERFEQQLKEAESRQDCLLAAVDRLREEREKRQSALRLTMPSSPILQD